MADNQLSAILEAVAEVAGLPEIQLTLIRRATARMPRNNYVFRTAPKWTKPEIKQFLQKAYGVKVARVATINYPRETCKRVGARGISNGASTAPWLERWAPRFALRRLQRTRRTKRQGTPPMLASSGSTLALGRLSVLPGAPAPSTSLSLFRPCLQPGTRSWGASCASVVRSRRSTSRSRTTLLPRLRVPTTIRRRFPLWSGLESRRGGGAGVLIVCAARALGLTNVAV